MEILKGKSFSAPKLLIYGGAGSGKSTLASKLSKPLFLDFEGGLGNLDVYHSPVYTDLDVFYKDLADLYHKAEGGKREFDTIVIDSVDWLVRKTVEKAAGINPQKLDETLNKSNGGYGNGKQVLENHIRSKLLPALVMLNKKGYGICLIAHADRKDLMDAEGVDIARIAPKIDINTMNVFVEWVDNVFYLKKTNGKRTLVLEENDDILAKNRLGLTGEVDLDGLDINKLLIPKEEEGE